MVNHEISFGTKTFTSEPLEPKPMSRREVQEERMLEILTLARKISRGELPQDERILCPHNSGGYFCSWIAGHYGGCSLGEPHRQYDYI